MKILSMDPGDNTGVVVWEDGELQYTDFWALKAKQKKLSIAERQKILTNFFSNFLLQKDHLEKPFDLFVIEGVSLWGGSSKSQASASTGSSFRLAYLVGAYVNMFQQGNVEDTEVVVVDVRTWKGSLPTPILEKEVEYLTDVKPVNEHVACAMGIGLWKLGKL